MIYNKMPASSFIPVDDSPEPSSDSIELDSSSPPLVDRHAPPRLSRAHDEDTGFLATIKSLFRGRSDSTLREALEEYIDAEEEEGQVSDSVSYHEKTLISNVLKLRDMTVFDVMLPRADIVSIDIDTPQEELLLLLSQKQFSRLPVYQGALDDVLGTIHIKDILGALARGERVAIHDLIRKVPIVSPSLHVLDLLLQMRKSRKHMAMVVDEFGGVDGLITIGDVVESIVGQIEDEHGTDQPPDLTVNADGTVLADARVDLSEFENRFGSILTYEEREDNDTLGGLAFSMAGRVPARGEVLTHTSGMVFEVLDADPRRISRLRITNIP